MMEAYLQFGYGMMEHCRQLLAAWGGGTVILSPRDLTDQQMVRLSAEINGSGDGRVLLDPQFYLPYADHERLCSHDFWPKDYDTGTFWQGHGATELLSRLTRLNNRLGTASFILPGTLATAISDDWLMTHRSLLEEAGSLDDGLELIATVALSADAARDQSQVAKLLENAVQWPVKGYYLVCEHPNGEYLVQDPNWVANLLDLAVGLRLAGAKVILGYCNQQMLVAAVAKGCAICSGTWMNVRSFPPDKFRTSYEEEIRQRATWYYCPQALSEYKLPFLDIAHRQGVLDRMAPPPELDGGYASVLFGGAQPSSVGFSEQSAFRHYLHALRGQAMSLRTDSYDGAMSALEDMLSQAERLLSALRATGVRGQHRDFAETIDVNRAALAVLDSTRGAMLRRRWGSL